MPDAMFTTLYDATANVVATPVAEIERRGRRINLRRKLMTVAAAGLVLVVGYGAIALAQPGTSRQPAPPAASASPQETAAPSVTPTTPPSSSGASSTDRPTLTSVPVAAMLQPADFGNTWQVVDNPDAEGDWDLGAVLGYCPAYRAASSPSGQRDRRVRTASPTNGAGPAGLVQEVELYRTGAAQATFQYYRAGAVACAKHVSELGSTAITVTIPAEGFAGDLSMIVRSESEYGIGVYVFVVVGDLFTQFTAPNDDLALGRQLGIKAAQRMCAAQGRC